jgi:hypothetical protein
MENINITPSELRKICRDYYYDEEAHKMMADDEDERPYIIKRAMSKLDKSEFIIFCLYMEHQSERKVANLLGCSRTPCHNMIVKIKDKIKSLI